MLAHMVYQSSNDVKSETRELCRQAFRRKRFNFATRTLFVCIY